MKTRFLHGALLDPELFRHVVGRDVSSAELRETILSGHKEHRLGQGVVSVLAHDAYHNVLGSIFEGEHPEEVERLDFLAAGLGLDLAAVDLGHGRIAGGYFAKNISDVGPWDQDHWSSKWKALACQAAVEIMDQYGILSVSEIARQSTRSLVRAQSQLNAKGSRHGHGTLRGRVEIETRDRNYAHFYALDEYRLRHETFDGTLSESIERGVFVTVDAALVLPYDPATDRVLVVEQFRVGPLARRDTALWQWEPIAGLIDPGETPEETAYRESVEEAGLRLSALEKVSEGYASPGCTTDFHYIFVGLCDLAEDETRTGGLAEEGEDIRARVMPFEDLMALAEDQRLANVPLTLACYWLAHHRARLRSA